MLFAIEVTRKRSLSTNHRAAADLEDVAAQSVAFHLPKMSDQEARVGLETPNTAIAALLKLVLHPLQPQVSWTAYVVDREEENLASPVPGAGFAQVYLSPLLDLVVPLSPAYMSGVRPAKKHVETNRSTVPADLVADLFLTLMMSLACAGLPAIPPL